VRATVLSALHIARAQTVEVKLQRAQTFFARLGAEDVECLRRNPQIAVHMKMLARELQTLASAVGAEVTGFEDEERQIA
jgi:hypothetical protein